MTAIRNKKHMLLTPDQNGRQDVDISLDAGLNGFEADFRLIANSQPHIQNPSRYIVTRTPGWMDNHVNAEQLKRQFIYLIETHPENWSGVEISSTISTGERAAGWDGQMTKAPTNRVVNPITPVASYKAIGEGVDIVFWNYLIDTSIIKAKGQRPDFGELITIPATWGFEDFTFDMLVYEPNSTFTRARWAVAIAGLWASTPVAIALDRNVSDARKIREYSMTFEGGVYDDSQSTIDSASAIETSLGVNRIKTSTQPSFMANADDFDVGVSEGLLNEIRTFGQLN